MGEPVLEPGMKVECINDDGVQRIVRRGSIYTVVGCGFGPLTGLPMLYLAEVGGGGPGQGMYASRFRPLRNRSTDISIFKEIVAREFSVTPDTVKKREKVR